jgi:hypothetical protein
MVETFLLAEEKHVQEPFLLHRTRSFRVARSFHDHAAGQNRQRSDKHARHVRTECLK